MLIKLPKEDPIRFLVERRFPDYRILMGPLDSVRFVGGENQDRRENLKKRKVKLEEYESKLKKLSHQDLQSLYKTEREKHKQEVIIKLDEEEQLRFFNQPNSDADFEYWSKASYWTLEECIALSFGKEPSIVKWDKLKGLDKYPKSPFIEKYRKTRDLARRAQVTKQINDPSLPGAFIAWAKSINIGFPRQLADLVELTGSSIADWKSLYVQIKKKYELLEDAKQALEQNLDQLTFDSSQQDLCMRSKYLQSFHAKANRAINEYPVWKKSQRKIQKTGNLHNWLKQNIHASEREAELIKKIMSDIFDDLR